MLGRIPGTALAVVVLARRFEIHPLEVPAHRPVHAPAELNGLGRAEVHGFLAAALAMVAHAPFPVPAVDLGRVLVASVAEHAHRPPFALDLVLVVADLVQDILERRAVLKRLAHPLRVHGGAVALGLVQELRLDPDDRQHGLHVNLVVARVAPVAVPGIGHHGDREAQMRGQQLLVGHVDGNLAEDVIIVPGIDEADLLAHVAQRAHHEIHGNNLAEVPDMHRARRGDARSAGIAILFALLADDLLRCLVGPMQVLVVHS